MKHMGKLVFRNKNLKIVEEDILNNYNRKRPKTP